MELRVKLNVAHKTWTFDFVMKSLRLLKMLLALEVIFDLFWILFPWYVLKNYWILPWETFLLIFQDPNLLTKYSVQQIDKIFSKGEKIVLVFCILTKINYVKVHSLACEQALHSGISWKVYPREAHERRRESGGRGKESFLGPSLLASLAQVGEIVRRLYTLFQIYSCGLLCDGWFCITDKIIIIHINSVSSVTN